MNMKKILVTTTATALLIIGVGAVGAQDDTAPEAPPSGEFRGPFGDGERGGRFGDGQFREQFRSNRGFISDEAIALTEAYTGLSGVELHHAVREADSLAAVIEANGEDVSAYIAEAVALAEARVDEAVANGNLDAERAETLKENLATRIEARVNGEKPPRIMPPESQPPSSQPPASTDNS